MTINEINEKIDSLESHLFYLEMKDHWTDKDWERCWQIEAEIKALRKQLPKEEVRA